MGKTLCPLCNRRKVRRACPALNQKICAICCGTKRLVEIDCPPDCGYLEVARAHPPVVEQRRRERDFKFLAEIIHDLNERQRFLFMIIQSFIRGYRPETVPTIVDEDVVAAATALAKTLETAERGIIYEHQSPSLPAQRLITEIKIVLDQHQKDEWPSYNRDASVVLRKTEWAAKEAQNNLDGAQTAYLDLLERILRKPSESAQVSTEQPTAVGSDKKLIIP